MKIFQYIPTASFFLGGGEIVPLNQAIALANEHHEVTLGIARTNLKDKLLGSYDLSKINIIEFDVLADHEGFVNSLENTHKEIHMIYLGLSRKVNEYLTENKFDIVITHYPPANFCIPKSTQLVFFLHGVPPNWDTIGDEALRLADKIIAVSNSVGEGWKEKFNFKGNVDVLQNGVDTEIFNFSTKPRKNLLFTGRLEELKGVQYLIEAISILKNKNIDFGKLVIVGDGKFRQELEDKVEGCNVFENVEFLGRVEIEVLKNLYQTSSIGIFPSFEREGVLTTMLESAASGCPIITCDCCGMIDFAKNDYNSLLVEPKSSLDIAEKIELLLKNPDLASRISKQARSDVEISWSWKNYPNKLLSIINK